jgi:hypothetical protein
MRPVRVRTHRRETVNKALGDETLRGQVIAVMELLSGNYGEHARVAFDAARVQNQAVQNGTETPKPFIGLLERYAPDKAVHFKPKFEQMFGEITAILSRYPRYKSFTLYRCLLHRAPSRTVSF